ncbi:MAG TPA: hypothetical protein VGF07_13165 [Stellaceae bacterium]|jgi:hypothetical protein
MTAPPASPEPSGKIGVALGLVYRLLDYMKTPWQALTVIALVVILGLGWGLWSERSVLVSALVQSKKHGPVVLKSDLTPYLDGLLSETTADLVSVWRVDFATNTQHYVGSSKRGGGVWPPGDGQLPALTETSSMKTVVKLLNGQATCHGTDFNTGNLLLRRLAGDGYTWICVVPVPPGVNDMPLAVVYLAWKQRPDAANEAAARSAATVAADKMVLR